MNEKQAHFSDDQISSIREIFQTEANKVLLKIILGNIVAIFIGVGTIAVGWYRLQSVETQVAAIYVAVSPDTYVSKAVYNADKASLEKSFVDMQRQLDALNSTNDRIETKVDQLLLRK